MNSLKQQYGRYSKMALFATLLLLLVSPTETAFKTEQIYYIACFGLVFSAWISSGISIKKGAALYLLIFIIYTIMTSLWSPAQGIERTILVKVVVVMFTFLQLQFDYTEEQFEKIKIFFLWQLIILILMVAVFGFVDWDGRLWIKYGNVSTDPNSITSWLIIPACFLVERIFNQCRMVKKIIYFVLLAVTLGITFTTASRAGIVCVTLAVFLSVIYTLRNIIRTNPGVSILILLLLIVGIIVAFNYIPESVISRFTTGDLSELGGRSRIWKLMIEYLKTHPLALIFGCGEGATISIFGVVAHNMYLELLISQGIVGIILIGSFIVSGLKNLRRINPYCAIAFICMIIMSATLSEFTSRPVMLAFFLAGIHFTSEDLI